MAILKTKSLGGERYSIEKVASAVITLGGAAIGLGVVTGVIDPEAGDNLTSGLTASVTRLTASIAEVWPVLMTVAGLWWRKRVKADDES